MHRGSVFAGNGDAGLRQFHSVGRGVDCYKSVSGQSECSHGVHSESNGGSLLLWGDSAVDLSSWEDGINSGGLSGHVVAGFRN